MEIYDLPHVVTFLTKHRLKQNRSKWAAKWNACGFALVFCAKYLNVNICNDTSIDLDFT